MNSQDNTMKEVGNEYNTVEIVQYKQKTKKKGYDSFLGVTHWLIISPFILFYWMEWTVSLCYRRGGSFQTILLFDTNRGIILDNKWTVK